MCLRDEGGLALSAAISCGHAQTRHKKMRTTPPAEQRTAELDTLDRAILAELQADGRLSNV